MGRVTIFGDPDCAACLRVKDLFEREIASLPACSLEFIDCNTHGRVQQCRALCGGASTLPQVFLNGSHLSSVASIAELRERLAALGGDGESFPPPADASVVKISADVAASSQLTQEQLAGIRRSGVRAVISVIHPEEPEADEGLAAACIAVGLEFYAVPPPQAPHNPSGMLDGKAWRRLLSALDAETAAAGALAGARVATSPTPPPDLSPSDNFTLDGGRPALVQPQAPANRATGSDIAECEGSAAAGTANLCGSPSLPVSLPLADSSRKSTGSPSSISDSAMCTGVLVSRAACDELVDGPHGNANASSSPGQTVVSHADSASDGQGSISGSSARRASRSSLSFISNSAPAAAGEADAEIPVEQPPPMQPLDSCAVNTVAPSCPVDFAARVVSGLRCCAVLAFARHDSPQLVPMSPSRLRASSSASAAAAALDGGGSPSRGGASDAGYSFAEAPAPACGGIAAARPSGTRLPPPFRRARLGCGGSGSRLRPPLHCDSGGDVTPGGVGHGRRPSSSSAPWGGAAEISARAATPPALLCPNSSPAWFTQCETVAEAPEDEGGVGTAADTSPVASAPPRHPQPAAVSQSALQPTDRELALLPQTAAGGKLPPPPSFQPLGRRRVSTTSDGASLASSDDSSTDGGSVRAWAAVDEDELGGRDPTEIAYTVAWARAVLGMLASCPKPALVTSATGAAACCIVLLHASLQRRQAQQQPGQQPAAPVAPRQVFKWLRALGHSLDENQDLAVIVDRILAAD